MEISLAFSGTNVTASPCGQWLACVANGKLRIHPTHALARYNEFTLKIPAKEISTLNWSRGSKCILAFSTRNIDIVDLEDDDRRIRIDNGSGGLGGLSSAEFMGDEHVLVVWEFGRARLWDLRNGKGVELEGIKTTCEGNRWAIRTGFDEEEVPLLAYLSRTGADDFLYLHLATAQTPSTAVKIPSVDAKSINWSPDGRWLAILDTPTAATSVHIYAADGHYFRSYPASEKSHSDEASLGVKNMTWSTDGCTLAVTGYDNIVTILNTRTFTPLIQIEHTTTIDRRCVPDQQARVWQESVSSAKQRSYVIPPQPVSLPLARSKPPPEPTQLGILETRFNCEGDYVATRDERTPNTVWIWCLSTSSTHSVFIQHNVVRKMQWHQHRPELLLFDCGESIVYILDKSSRSAPELVRVSLPALPVFGFVPSPRHVKPSILASTKNTFCVIYLEGRDSTVGTATSSSPKFERFDEDVSEDSLADILTGKTPVPQRTELSYTERVDLAADADESIQLDDTFREKRTSSSVNRDPMDDSDIF